MRYHQFLQSAFVIYTSGTSVIRGHNSTHNLQDPGHHFKDESVGVLTTNSSVLGSKVAVVSNPLMNVPETSKDKKKINL